MNHLYYMLNNGELVSKRKVDDALDLIDKVKKGFTIVNMSDEELFSNGNKFDAIKRFHEKYDVGLLEAKCAIEFLRGEELNNV